MPRKSQETKDNELNQAYAFLHRQIFNRTLTPGTELRVKDLLAIAKKRGLKGISTAGISAAIGQLLYQGAAIREGGRIKVVYQDAKRQHTLIGARIVTEATIVQSLCQTKMADLSPALAIHSKLKKYIREKGQSFSDLHALDFATEDLEFHLALADADRNPAAKELITAAYHALVIPLPDPLPRYEHAVAIIREHEDVLRAINSRDAKAAMRSLYIHLSAAVGRWYTSVPEFVDEPFRAVLQELASTPLVRGTKP